MGQFFTKNSDTILSGFEEIVRGRDVIDPFAGEHDLLKWAARNGCSSFLGYDLDPKIPGTIQNDSIFNPPDYTGRIVLTNPPYLSKNKCKTDKSVYERWGQNDLYKCHLASLASHGCDETIQIIPSNFLSESRDASRRNVFASYSIKKATYWTEPVFDDATTGICVIHMVRGGNDIQEFPVTLMPDNVTFDARLDKKYSYLHGIDILRLMDETPEIEVIKTDVGMDPPNTNIVIGLLDNGKWPIGISYNDGNPVYCNPKSFTTYQVTLPKYELSEQQQRRVCDIFQDKFTFYRDKYHGMFLANYMGANQKILSRKYAHLLLSHAVLEVVGKPTTYDRFFS